ncbi:MAG: argininosuccinate synthase, partial [Rhodocyclales bacterium]|nr:argininosuccinate synthase [Rhodocyclales bacterium]
MKNVKNVVKSAVNNTTKIAAKPEVKATVNKVVLAYSGGLDTSVILKWLQDEYQCEVVTFT